MTPLTPGYHACPAHTPDHSPSLYVSQGEDGRWLIHCFAGCEPAAILAAWGLTWADCFPPGSLPPRRPRGPWTEASRAVATVHARAERAARRRRALIPRGRDADEARHAEQVIRAARQAACGLDPDRDATWELLSAAMDLELDVWRVYGE